MIYNEYEDYNLYDLEDDEDTCDTTPFDEWLDAMQDNADDYEKYGY